jgi:glycine rich protein
VSEHRHGPTAPRGTTTVTFDHTGSAQSWTVPEGVTEAAFVVNGAAGGVDTQGATGLGGRVEATLTVAPGAVYTIVVGGAGESIRDATGGRVGGRVGYGWGPGGTGGPPAAGFQTAMPGAGGGGGSAVLLGTDALLVAGGGGGSSNNPGAGGAGGGAQGGAGQAHISTEDSLWNGQGGTPTAPGAGAVGITANHGGPGVGHTGGAGGTGYPDSGGGGGGGGWFGGGGGASGDMNVGAGGGASGYAAAGTGATLTAGVRNGDGDGQVTIAYSAPPAHPSPPHRSPTRTGPAVTTTVETGPAQPVTCRIVTVRAAAAGRLRIVSGIDAANGRENG